MTQREFKELIDKYLSGQCNEQEVQLLHKFYDHFQTDELWQDSLGNKDNFETALLTDINRRIDRKERKEYEESRVTSYLSLKIAASIILMISIGLWVFQGVNNSGKTGEANMVQKMTHRGQKSTVLLSDGTKIKLNSNSKVSFPEHFSDSKREIVLEGEAFFEVARDESRPFIIHSGELVTTVLGTSFNIKAFPEENIQVTVATGKVKVESQSDDKEGIRSMYLVPNEQANFDFDSKLFEKRIVDLEEFLAWKEGQLRFKEIELQEATKILERWYGISISFKNEEVKHCKIRSGRYKDENLYNILQSFSYILNIEYEVKDQHNIVISGKGCGQETLSP